VATTPVSSTNKTDHCNITEMLLKVALNNITITPHFKVVHVFINPLFNRISTNGLFSDNYLFTRGNVYYKTQFSSINQAKKSLKISKG
jgi:hypothetical protein